MKLLNAFSPSMLEGATDYLVSFRELSLEEARRLAQGGLESAVGHAGTAEVFAALLGVPVPPARVFVTLAPGEEALVGSLNARLPEGKVLTTEELAGLPIRWLLVRREARDG